MTKRIINNQKWLEKDVNNIKKYIEKNTTSKDGIIYIPLDDLHIHRVNLNDRNIETPSEEEYETILSQKLHLITRIDYSCNVLKINLNNKDYRKKTFLADGALFLGWGLTTFWIIFLSYAGIHLNKINPYGHVFVNNAIVDPFIGVGLALVSAVIGGLLLFYSFDRNNFIKRYRLNKKFFN